MHAAVLPIAPVLLVAALAQQHPCDLAAGGAQRAETLKLKGDRAQAERLLQEILRVERDCQQDSRLLVARALTTWRLSTSMPEKAAKRINSGSGPWTL